MSSSSKEDVEQPANEKAENEEEKIEEKAEPQENQQKEVESTVSEVYKDRIEEEKDSSDSVKVSSSSSSDEAEPIPKSTEKASVIDEDEKLSEPNQGNNLKIFSSEDAEKEDVNKTRDLQGNVTKEIELIISNSDSDVDLNIIDTDDDKFVSTNDEPMVLNPKNTREAIKSELNTTVSKPTNSKSCLLI